MEPKQHGDWIAVIFLMIFSGFVGAGLQSQGILDKHYCFPSKGAYDVQ